MPIVSQRRANCDSFSQDFPPSLTAIAEALEKYQFFAPVTRATATALYAAELNTNSLHFYAIALQAGLRGVA